MVTKKLKHKNASGEVIEADIGADAKNVTEDSSHRFVTDEEKKKWNAGGTTIPVKLSANGWTGEKEPYVQTVTAEGLKADREMALYSLLADGADKAAQEAYNKAFAIISSGTAVTGDGTATFKVYKKPETDCSVGLRGMV